MVKRDVNQIRKFVNVNRSILYGTMLGDATIASRGQASYLRINHSFRQEEYLLHKHKLLSEVAEEVKLFLNAESGHGYWYFRTVPSPVWQSVWSTFHQDSVKRTVGKKTYISKVVTPQILSALDDHGVALWVMDDGMLSCWLHPNGKRYQQFFKLSTCCFTEQENEMIVDWLGKRYGIRARIGHQTNKLQDGTFKTYPFVVMGREAYRVIRDRIAPYVPDCMSHKIAIKENPLPGQGRLPEIQADEDALRTSGRPEEAAETTARLTSSEARL